MLPRKTTFGMGKKNEKKFTNLKGLEVKSFKTETKNSAQLWFKY